MVDIFKGHELETPNRIKEIANKHDLKTFFCEVDTEPHILIENAAGMPVYIFNKHVIDGYYIKTWDNVQALGKKEFTDIILDTVA